LRGVRCPCSHTVARNERVRSTLACIIYIYSALVGSSSSTLLFLIAHPIPPNANETRCLRQNSTQMRNRMVAHLHPIIRFPATPRAVHRPSPRPSLLRVWTKIRTRTVTMLSLTSTLQLTFQRYQNQVSPTGRRLEHSGSMGEARSLLGASHREISTKRRDSD